MRILIVIPKLFPIGGVEKLTIDLVKELFRRNIFVDLLIINEITAENLNEHNQIKNFVSNIYFFGLKINPNYLYFFSSIRKIKNIITQGNYDLIESSSVSGSILLCWTKLIKPFNSKLLIGLHFCQDHPSFGFLRDLIFKYSLRICKPNYIYGVSDAVINSFKNYKLKNPIIKISNSIGNEFFQEKVSAAEISDLRLSFNLKIDSKILLYIGRVDLNKGIEMLFEATYPIINENTVLFVIGSIDKNAFEVILKFKSKLKENNKDKYVFFQEPVSNVPLYMKLCDVLIFPSLSEAFGIVLLEGLASGIPIVANNIDGVSELLESTGSILIKPCDPHLLREAILVSLNLTKNEKKSIVRIGKIRANKYLIENRVDKILSLIG